MNYIKIQKVYDKLKNAEATYSPVIMTAAAGWGKTAAVNYYYRRKSPIIVNCVSGENIDEKKILSQRGSVIIIDDMHHVKDQKDIDLIKRLLSDSGRQIVMLTRGTVPKYLSEEYMDMGFVRVFEEDFAFENAEVYLFFKEMNAKLHPDDVALVTGASKGYVRALASFAAHMGNGRRFSVGVKEAVKQDMLRLWDNVITDTLSPEYIEFSMSICVFDSFPEEMAAYIMGDEVAYDLIEYGLDMTSQLVFKEGGNLALRDEIKAYWRRKRKAEWSEEKSNANYRKAGDYYFEKGDIPTALKYYREGSCTDKVKELLVLNVLSHPGIGHYVETKEYYFELPREEVEKSPVLMAGICMLYSLILMPEKSEEWYSELQAFHADKSNSKEARHEAKIRLAYLDIALPHRGTKGILKIMKNVFTMMNKGEVYLPEFCSTGNLPSIMNGGLDFCEWSKSDNQIATLMGQPIEKILGRYGNGLVSLALAESGFYKGSLSSYEIFTKCNEGYAAALQGGRIEMCFVSAGIQIKQHIVDGHFTSAMRILESIKEKIRSEEAAQLYTNLEAFESSISLYKGENDTARAFVEKTPDATVDFCVFDRYRQLVKLHCLIAENRYDEALELSMFLTGYFVSYDRRMCHMENEILKAIILYRMDNPIWMDVMEAALKETEEYYFYRIISKEGAAVYPLLVNMKDADRFNGISREFVDAFMEETERVAIAFPDYLKHFPKENIILTKRENQVLALLCAGKRTDEICDLLHISYDGLKKHNRNLYKKLGAKDRAEAERNAVRLGLVHRGT